MAKEKKRGSRNLKDSEKTPKNSKKPFEFLKIEHPAFIVPKTFGQEASDWLAKWVGSWVFIILLAITMVFWIAINTSWLIFGREWDPYPFILLNFVLSTLAAIQAPVILMSQNRTSERDRAHAQYDYAVNRKSEREIQELRKQLNRIERTMSRKGR